MKLKIYKKILAFEEWRLSKKKQKLEKMLKEIDKTLSKIRI